MKKSFSKHLNFEKILNLVNGTRDKTGHVLLVAEDEGKRRRERWNSLNGGKHDLANVGAVVKAKNSQDLWKKGLKEHVIATYFTVL